MPNSTWCPCLCLGVWSC